MPSQITITLPDEATAGDADAVVLLLKRALPQAGVLVTFCGAGLSVTSQARIRALLPRARVALSSAAP